MAGRQTSRELPTSYTQTRRQTGKQTDTQTFYAESAQTSHRLAISYMSSQTWAPSTWIQKSGYLTVSTPGLWWMPLMSILRYQKLVISHQRQKLRTIACGTYTYTSASTTCQMRIMLHSGWSDSSSEVRNAGPPTALGFFKVWCSYVQS